MSSPQAPSLTEQRLTKAWKQAASHRVPLFLLCLGTALLSIGVSLSLFFGLGALIFKVASFGLGTLALLPLTILVHAFSLSFAGLLLLIAAHYLQSDAWPSAAYLWQRLRPRLTSLALTALLGGTATVLGSYLMILPGMVAASLTLLVLMDVVDRQLSPLQSLQELFSAMRFQLAWPALLMLLVVDLSLVACTLSLGIAAFWLAPFALTATLEARQMLREAAVSQAQPKFMQPSAP